MPDASARFVKELQVLVEARNWREAARFAARIPLWELKSSTAASRIQTQLAEYGRLSNDQAERLLREFIDAITTVERSQGRVFIVHGWDNELKLETKNFIQNTLAIECLILHEQDGAGQTIIDKFERFARRCDVAAVLLSDRDEGPDSFTSPDAVKRPRPNVLFELGYFFGTLGRERVIILRRGKVEIHSDILGIEYIDVSMGVEAAGERLRRRLAWLSSLR
jgi:predicted nucleotide-binding protein